MQVAPASAAALRLRQGDRQTGRRSVDPAVNTAVPMTFLHQGKQYIVFATGQGDRTSLVALTLPRAARSADRANRREERGENKLFSAAFCLRQLAIRRSPLALDVPLQRLRSNFRPIDHARRVDCNALGRTRARRFVDGSGMNAVTEPSVALPIRMPRFHAVLSAAPPNPTRNRRRRCCPARR